MPRKLRRDLVKQVRVELQVTGGDMPEDQELGGEEWGMEFAAA
jgi:hypothetical protein